MRTAILSLRSICGLMACLLLAGPALAQPRASITHDGPAIEGAPVECESFDAYQQPVDPANLSTARTSDEESIFSVAEAFVDDTGTITPYNGSINGIRWWGINFDFIMTFCTDDDDANTPFTVTFWDDEPDVGNVVCQQTGVVPTIVDTGIPFNVTTIGEYSAELDECDATGATWVEIERDVGVAGCFWLWVDESLVGSYDDTAWQNGNPPPVPPDPSDQTMCLQAPADPPIVEVPSLGQLGLLALLLSLLGAGIYRIRRDKK